MILHTDEDGLEGHGLTFTIGRGTEVVCAACRSVGRLVVGHDLAEFTANMGAFWRYMVRSTSPVRDRRKKEWGPAVTRTGVRTAVLPRRLLAGAQATRSCGGSGLRRAPCTSRRGRW